MRSRSVKFVCLCLSIVILLANMIVGVYADEGAQSTDLGLECKSAVLMEAQTGKVLYAQNESTALPPASVTKVMTLLLVMEALQAGKITLDQTVVASENACSMGGSQIFLEFGEQMSVDDLLKSVVIASANDAAVALAEHIAGTESAFVDMMNKRAQELGMNSTCFENTNGLDDTTENHVTSALDIAIMSRELIKHPKITEYSSIWMDSIRGGEFTLTNTNRLIRFYKGATGLKTGSTTKAGFCISATATRDGMTLIAVIMGAPSRDARNGAAVSLLNYGFSNFALWKNSSRVDQSIKVTGGTQGSCRVVEEEIVAVVDKRSMSHIQKSVELPESIGAPIGSGEQIGTVIYSVDGKEIGQARIVTCEAIRGLNFVHIFLRLLSGALVK